MKHPWKDRWSELKSLSMFRIRLFTVQGTPINYFKVVLFVYITIFPYTISPAILLLRFQRTHMCLITELV